MGGRAATTVRGVNTGRAAPTGDDSMQAWLLFDCGTLAADPAAGSLGFGVLETDGTTVTARPIRIGTGDK